MFQGLDNVIRSASKGWKILLSAVILTAAGGVAAADAAGIPWVRISPRDARYLELSDGTPFIPNGLNMVYPGGPKGQEQACMERWVDALSTNGGNLIRIWMWHSWWCPERAPGVFDEEGARRLRALLDYCGPRGVRVKVTLDYFREVDPANPGKTWALRESYHVSKGGPVASMKEFWDSPAGRALFLKRLDWLAERFRDRPEIFGWELWNEIDAAGGGAASQYAWTRDMLAELRKRFPHHLVMQSLGSFDRASVRDTYRRHAMLADNDLTQVHRYLDLGAALDVCKGPMDILAADATREMLAFDARKPVLLAESGAVEPRHAGPFKLYAQDREGVLLHDVLFAPFFAGAAGSGQCWHWTQYIDPNGLWWQFGRFARTVAGLDPAAEAFRPAAVVTNGPLRVYALDGRRTVLAWCRDGRADWRSDLERGNEPETVRDAWLDLGGILRGRAVARASSYDPWRDVSDPLSLSAGRTTLPPFRRSIVVRVELAAESK